MTRDIIGTGTAKHRVNASTVQWRPEWQRVAPTCRRQPHPVFFRDDFAFPSAGEFRPLSRLDTGDEVEKLVPRADPVPLKDGDVVKFGQTVVGNFMSPASFANLLAVYAKRSSKKPK